MNEKEEKQRFAPMQTVFLIGTLLVIFVSGMGLGYALAKKSEESNNNDQTVNKVIIENDYNTTPDSYSPDSFAVTEDGI